MKIIGLMSGTSVDGIDAALTEVTGQGYKIKAELIKGITLPYPAELRSTILAHCAGQPIGLADFAGLDDAIALHCIQAIHALNIDLTTVELIGSHGQTLHHRPPTPNQLGHTLQLGRGDLIAHKTSCPTVSNFRVADMALSGQGAPLVPLIDACLLSQAESAIAVQNIGGIGNLTYLPPWDSAVLPAAVSPVAADSTPPTGVKGWDTGPGNALIDWAVTQLTQGAQTYDKNGAWARQGKPDSTLITAWIQQPFFQLPPPKSTGRELFGADYAQQCWQAAQANGLSEADFLATLTDFTAATIELSYRQFLPVLPSKVLIGGGGSRNAYLMECLQQRLPETQVCATDTHQLNADYKEAIAFAVLAYWRWHQIPGNLPSVTGASRPCLLGEIWQP
ncbi:MAG: anhydro-N-acetylmuramic acid kinase [Cyanobacteria bacterium J06626_6]